ncbi:MAG: hypothetical protein CMB82_01200 [Flammeovirgaceae bacterium]|nr:hypothetical protein [Flammeovirgaceae bacterium]|tara:strand:- start:51 stop:464 length:414 start_codon:yes stop_codon:yes gene_type:complete
MNHFKQLLFLSILCSLLVFTNCNCDCQDSINNAFKLFCIIEACNDDAKNRTYMTAHNNNACQCGAVLEWGYVSQEEDSVSCYSMMSRWSADVYAVIQNGCTGNIETFCGTGEDTLIIAAYGATTFSPPEPACTDKEW